MPTVSAIFSGGVSVGLLAGVVSGLFYLVVAGIRWAGRMRAAKERERLRLRDLQGRRMSQPQRKALAAAAGVDGSALETRGGDGGGREVKQQSEEWLYRQVQRRLCLQPASASASASAASCLCSAEDGEGMEPETVKVREFIERLVESLVSGELDNVCIKRLHSHAEYERMFACHHGPLCEALARLSFALQMAIAYKHMAGQDTPSAAHAALKQLIHQIIQEAMALPKFKGVRPIEEDMSLEDMSSKTYEDILATAILNKVIERYQQSDRRGNMDGNSNLLSPELMSLIAAHQPKLLTSSELGNDNRYFPNDSDALSELSNTDPLSVTIEECIEEVTTFSNGEEDDGCDSDSGLPGLDAFKNRRAPFPEYGRDIIDGLPLDVTHDGEGDEDEDESEDESSLQPTDIINPVDSWEENWLFQKRRLKVGGVQQPMPVPMLVPNPSEDYRALIGDRDAEDISDLSDCSDGALEELVHANEPITVPNKVAPGSDLVAGEINLIDDRFDGGELGSKQSECKPEKRSELNSMEAPVIVLNDADRELSNNIEELAEAKNLEFLKTTPDDCLSEFGQQEGEYTEDYAAVTHRRQMDSLTETSDADSHDVPEIPSTPIPQLSPETSTVDGAVVAILDSLTPEEIVPGESTNIDHPNQDFVKPPLPGTIAEREHKKWETAPPLPNNPYSPENITKRLNKRHAFVRNNSSSDASIEFPELKGDSEERAAQPLQVVCSPSDVDYKRYGRDYYINTESTAASGTITQNSSVSSTPEVSDATLLSVAKLEKQILHRDVYHSSFRARNASPHFKMNPLYETDKENVTNVENKDVEKSHMFQDDTNNVLKCNTSDNSLVFETKALNAGDPTVRTNPLYSLSSSENSENSQQMTDFTTYINPEEELTEYSKVSIDEGPERLEQFSLVKITANHEGSSNSNNNHNQIMPKRENCYSESGYSSSLDSLHDPSLFMLRLTPPSQPQMVERSFETLSSIRRSGSLRVGARKRKAVPPPFMGGSLRICRRQHALAKDLW